MDFQATCPSGLEGLLAQELKRIGLRHVRPLQGMVTFAGELKDGYKACLWSRIASRIVVVLGSFPCENREGLYEGVHEIPWEEHLSPATTFAVFTTGSMAGLENSMYVSQRVKDAVVDRLFSIFGTRPDVDPTHPDLRLQVRLRPGHATVGIDLSGEPLFRRGYERERRGSTLTSLRPDYAAALLELAAWPETGRTDGAVLSVAFSGTGTLLCEGAAMALDIAPGLMRTHWGFDRWESRSETSWAALVNQATKRAEKAADRDLHLRAWDIRPGAGGEALAVLRASGITAPLESLAPADGSQLGVGLEAPCLVAADLGWIRADGAAVEAEALAGMAAVATGLVSPTPLAAATRDGALEALLGHGPQEEVAIKLGSADGTLASYNDGAMESASTVEVAPEREVAVLVPTTDQFAARLAKDIKTKKAWATEEDVSCYRLYDRDLPDYNLSLDIYHGAPQTPGRWMVASEYAAPKEVDPDLARKRLLDVMAVAPAMTSVRPQDVFLKVRAKDKGGSQYATGGAPTEGMGKVHGGGRRDKDKGRPRRRFIEGVELPEGAHLVEEGGLLFEVNFQDRIDTGLFLDHRLVRAELRELAKATKGSKRFLNLFAYTGTGTVYAADGGAKHTTTVDLSWTYIDWARRNMERNGFSGEEHEYVKADVIPWIAKERRTRDRWDLIYCDPPTFSNSKSMRDGSFDVQRDHVELLIGISRLLTRDGLCIFSCNLRDFKPDVEALDRAGVVIEDVTEGTIPEDFQRNAKVHHVYRVTRRPFTPEELARIERNNKERAASGRPVDQRRGGFGAKAGGPKGPRRDGDRGHGGSKGPHGNHGHGGSRGDSRGHGNGPRSGGPRGFEDNGHGGRGNGGHGFKGGAKGGPKGRFLKGPHGPAKDPHGRNRAGQGRQGANGRRTGRS